MVVNSLGPRLCDRGWMVDVLLFLSHTILQIIIAIAIALSEIISHVIQDHSEAHPSMLSSPT